MGFLKQYMGLRKELYIIFWGRVVTNMGADLADDDPHPQK